MWVRNHQLYESGGTAVPFFASPNQSGGLKPLYLVIHYTATLTLEHAVGWFLKRAANASIHVIVDRDGTVVQMVPFDRRAWHAGKSRWGELEGLNAYSVGIELVNAGALDRAPSGDWVDWAGNRLPERDIVIARHKRDSRDRGWQAFTKIQIERALTIAKTLHQQYRFKGVLGHDDVAPDRKIDPGPAFPISRFASEILGEGRGSQQVDDGVGDRERTATGAARTGLEPGPVPHGGE